MLKRTSAVIDALEIRQHLSANQVVGYLTNYSLSGNKIDLNKIDFSALTQINYFAAKPSTGGVISFSAEEGARLDAVVAKAHSYGVKVSLSLGGANQDETLTSIVDSTAAGDSGPMDTLVSSINAAQTAHHIDGIDFDWEPINTSMTRINAYGTLLKAVQDGTTIQVSAAVNAEKLYDVVGSTHAGREYVLNDVGIKALDQIGVMAYDLETANHSSWTRTTNDLDAWATEVEKYAKPRDMLIFGLPFYGRAGDNWNNPMPSYKSIINNRLAQNPGETITSSQDSLWVSFASEYPGFNNNQGIEWFFNNKDTIDAKTNYANATAHVGGVMMWDLAQDHTDAQLNYTNYSLLPAIRTATNARGTMGATGAFAPNDAKPTFEVTFTQTPDASTLGPADLQLKNLTTGQAIDTSTLAHLHFNGNTVGWSFHAGLPDGNYQATLRGGSARTAAGNPLANDLVTSFYVLAGDANRDRVVGFDDLVPLSQNYGGSGKTFAQGDFNYDGLVNFDDLVILAQHYGRTMPAVGGISTSPGFSNVAIAGSSTPTKVGKGRAASDVLA